MVFKFQPDLNLEFATQMLAVRTHRRFIWLWIQHKVLEEESYSERRLMIELGIVSR